MDLPNKKYHIIYADPPWHYTRAQFQDKGRPFKHITEYYQTMTLDELKNIPILKITADNCALFMWIVDSHLKDGLELMDAWGFEYKTIAFVWLKKYSTGSTCHNYAPYTMKNVEIVYLGMKGSLERKKKNIPQLIEAQRTLHSKKPNAVRIKIEQLFGNLPRIELFTRQRHQGWDSWGNELSETIQMRLIA